MEIIDRGKLPEEREHTTTCGKCRTVFKFKEGEAKRGDSQRDGTWLEIHCPLCQTRLIIDI